MCRGRAGVLLSGGVDSSGHPRSCAVPRSATDKQIKTFTVGFDGNQVVDERPYARLSAKKYGTEHHEISITADDFWNFTSRKRIRGTWKRPVCEPPAVALYYVSKTCARPRM